MSTIAVLRRLGQLFVPNWQYMLLAVILAACTILSHVGLMGTSAYLLAAAALHPSVTELSLAIVGVRFFGIARAVLRYGERYFSHAATFRILRELRVEVYRKLEPLAPVQVADLTQGGLFSRLVADVELLRDFYLRALLPPAAALTVLGFAVYWLSRYSASLALALATAFFFCGGVLPWWVRRVSRSREEQLVVQREALQNRLEEGLRGMAELAAYGATEQWRIRLRQEQRCLTMLQRQLATTHAAGEALGGLIAACAVGTILFLAIGLVREVAFPAVYLAVIVLIAHSAFEAVLALPGAMQFLGLGLTAAKRLFAVIDRPPRRTGKETPQPGAALAFVGVSFAYSAGSTAVLQNVSFRLPPGGKIAILGPSGSGKTTIARLALGLWAPGDGTIRWGNQDVACLDGEAYRKQFAVVSQGDYLFHASIRENLRLARPAATEEEIRAAARLVELEGWIDTLPAGYDTMIGQDGGALSGGQRQRIALARAVLKDAPVLVLDEPTTGLDASTERQVMGALATWMAGKAVILITHRLVGLEHMDEILLLQDGRVAERGTYQELLQRENGLLRQWKSMQEDLLAEDGSV